MDGLCILITYTYIYIITYDVSTCYTYLGIRRGIVFEILYFHTLCCDMKYFIMNGYILHSIIFQSNSCYSMRGILIIIPQNSAHIPVVLSCYNRYIFSGSRKICVGIIHAFLPVNYRFTGFIYLIFGTLK